MFRNETEIKQYLAQISDGTIDIIYLIQCGRLTAKQFTESQTHTSVVIYLKSKH